MQGSHHRVLGDLVGDNPSSEPPLSREQWAAQAAHDLEIWIANARRILAPDAPRVRWVAGEWVEDPCPLPARARADLEAALARAESLRARNESHPLEPLKTYAFNWRKRVFHALDPEAAAVGALREKGVNLESWTPSHVASLIKSGWTEVDQFELDDRGPGE